MQCGRGEATFAVGLPITILEGRGIGEVQEFLGPEKMTQKGGV